MVVRCTTSSVSVEDRSGWTMFVALVQRLTLMNVPTVTGVSTTVYIAKTLLCRVTHGLKEMVCLCNRDCNAFWNILLSQSHGCTQHIMLPGLLTEYSWIITAWAVALSCYISHSAMHRKKADFDPSGGQNPEPILMKLGMVDYALDPTAHDK